MKNYHIGCGFVIGKSWLNYDNSLFLLIDKIPILNKIFRNNKNKFPKDAKYGNIVNNKFCNENSADNIYCCDVLEHVPLYDGRKMLRNIYKMLKPGGVLRIVVPSLESRVEQYNKSKDGNLFMKSLGCVMEDENNNLLKKVKFLFGGSRHKWMFDHKSLYSELKNSGFDNIRECEFADSNQEIFTEVESKDRFLEYNKLKAVAFHCIK
jgi:predicted SAM-dependent methyltransferase